MKKQKLYALFTRDKNGTLMSMYDASTVLMDWSYKYANLWDTPPVHYFNPKKGDFIVKIDRYYPDIMFTGRTMQNRPRNVHWINTVVRA